MITLTIIGTNGIIATAIIYFIFMLPAVYVAVKNEQPPFLLLWTLLIVLLPVIGTVVYAVVYTTRKKRKIRFELMPDHASQYQDQKTPAGIPEDTVKRILNFLDSFEKEENYLKPNITPAGLAKAFNVNSGELSKVIRFYKRKSFNTYINILRIDYLVEELRSGSDYRKYRMKPLAKKELGFGSERAFTIAFLRRTGMYPTVFIEALGYDQEEQWVLD